ncbi:MAG: CHAT domain-containing protein, partial [Bacteroidota bacterium]
MSKNHPPVLLFAFANSYVESSYLRNLPKERKQIKAVFAQAIADNLCELVILPDASLREIVDTFRKYTGRILLFHFGGHANTYTLHLETSYQKLDRLYMNSFAAFLAEQKGLSLVFLNACSTGPQHRELLAAGIPTVVATDNDISDPVAAAFATQFYHALSAGQNVDQAFKEATAIISSSSEYQTPRALYREEYSPNTTQTPWGIYHHAKVKERQPWNLPEVAGQPLYALKSGITTKYPNNPYLEGPSSAYARPEQAIFWGRDREIRKCYDYIVKEGVDLVLIYGPRGIGKTSFLKAGLLPYFEKDHSTTYYDDETISEYVPSQSFNSRVVLIDTPSTAARKKVLNNLSDENNKVGKRQFVIAIPTSQLADWWNEMEPGAFTFKRFYLSSFAPSAIREVISGGSENAITTRYGAIIEDDLITRLSITLSQDTTACNSLLLQYCLQQLWSAATRNSIESPQLSWDLYQRLVKEGLWERFLTDQLAALDTLYPSSGFTLNVLAEFLVMGEEKDYTCSQERILKRFPGRKPKVQRILNELLDRGLLCQPAKDSLEVIHELRLAHRILERPLYRLLHESQRPGQELQRILLHQLKPNNRQLLTVNQLKLWRSFKWTL